MTPLKPEIGDVNRYFALPRFLLLYTSCSGNSLFISLLKLTCSIFCHHEFDLKPSGSKEFLLNVNAAKSTKSGWSTNRNDITTGKFD